MNYGGTGTYDRGHRDFTYPPTLRRRHLRLRGRWTLDYQGATAESDDSRIALNYNAKNVYIVAGGKGDVTVTRNGNTTPCRSAGRRPSHQIVAGDDVASRTARSAIEQGLQAFSFTYG